MEDVSMKRREFLKRAGCFIATASTVGFAACDDEDKESNSPDGGADSGMASGKGASFAQGVASGDPQPTSVMLWTRAEPTQGMDAVSLRLEVSESDDFAKLVVDKMVQAPPTSDFTVRVYVEQLKPATTYYYRFSAGSDRSRVGRTRTAPDQDDDVEPRFAWVSCQDYAANFYGPYRRMINDDKDAAESEQLHFVLHMGDFIYETRDAGFMNSVTDDLEPVALMSHDGKPRVVPEFPDGATRPDGAEYANTVNDYRHLYKTFLADPDLQDARARWAFVNTWDDHEFTDVCWQTQANYTNDDTSDEPSQKRRLAASQAWFEYVPAALSNAKPIGDVDASAKDFKFVEVEDVKYDDVVVVDEPNNVKTISAVTLYRSFRYGKHLELVLTDNRSYRSDHALAEQATLGNPFILDPRVALPKDAVQIMDAGREANGGDPPNSVAGIDNTRKADPPGSMLGAKQKDWWKSVMRASTATFKVWGNSVPLLRFLLDATDAKPIPADLLLSDDGWDGFDTERKELMGYLKDNNILNVISLSGDHHAHFAGLVYDDYDASKPTPVMVDFTGAGISSNSQWAAVAAVLKSSPLAGALAKVTDLIVYDASDKGGPKAQVNLNTLILYGSAAGHVAAATNDPAMIMAARKDGVNAHLRHVDSHAFGYGLVHVRADACETTLVSIQRSFTDLQDKSPDVRYTAKFSVPKIDSLDQLKLDAPEYTGTKPFPLT
jgi:alkaline phosphatase D